MEPAPSTSRTTARSLRPFANIAGTVIAVGGNGSTTTTFDVENNVIAANNQFGSPGIAVGTGESAGIPSASVVNATINNNRVSGTDGNGILVAARQGAGSVGASITANNVSAPIGTNTYGIRVDAGNGASTDDRVCLAINGNTTAGSGVATGIGLRKQGVVTTTNDFGIVGLPGGTTSTPGVEAYVTGLQIVGTTELISAQSGFSSCTLPVN